MRRFNLMLAIGILIITLAVTLGSPAATRTNAPEGLELPILLYDTAPDEARLDADFEKIHEMGYRPILPSALVSHFESGAAIPSKSIIIAFTDAYLPLCDILPPLLEKHGYACVVGISGQMADSADRYASWEQIALLAHGGGVEIASRMYSDIAASSSEREVIASDILAAQLRFMDYIGIAPTTLIYKQGEVVQDAVPVLKELGFKAVITGGHGINYLTSQEGLFSLKIISEVTELEK